MNWKRTVARPLTVALASSLALVAIGCGGDDDSGDPETTATTAAAEPIDAAAFESCILNATVDRGVYKEVPQPDPTVEQVAADADAEFFEASKADDGIVFFYLPADPATAEELAGAVSVAVADLGAVLAASAPKGLTLGETSVEIEGPVVFGLLPFSEDKAGELAEETRSDVADCVSES